jgi:hypothetical protein
VAISCGNGVWQAGSDCGVYACLSVGDSPNCARVPVVYVRVDVSVDWKCISEAFCVVIAETAECVSTRCCVGAV